MSIQAISRSFSKKSPRAPIPIHTYALRYIADNDWMLSRWQGDITTGNHEEFSVPVSGTEAQMAQDKNTGRLVVLGTNAANMLYSDDAGETWHLCEFKGVPTNTANQRLGRLSWDATYGFLYTGGSNAPAGAIYSKDGKRWHSFPKTGNAFHAIFVNDRVALINGATIVSFASAAALVAAWDANPAGELAISFTDYTVATAGVTSMINDSTNLQIAIFRNTATSPGMWKGPVDAIPSPLAVTDANMSTQSVVYYSQLLKRYVIGRVTPAAANVMFLKADDGAATGFQRVPTSAGVPTVYSVCDCLELNKFLVGGAGAIYLMTPTESAGVISFVTTSVAITGDVVAITSDMPPFDPVPVIESFTPLPEPEPNAAMLDQYLNGTEYNHDWANLTGFNTNAVLVANNRLYGNGASNPYYAARPFVVEPGESAVLVTKVTRVAGTSTAIYAGFTCQAGAQSASLPSAAIIGLTTNNFQAFLGSALTGVTTGNRLLKERSTGGTFTITVAVTPDWVSLAIVSADGSEEGSLTIPRSSLPNGGKIEGVVFWNSDTRGTSGQYIHGFGVRKGLVPFRTKSVTGTVLEGDVKHPLHFGPANDIWRIQLPKVALGDNPTPVVVFVHQHVSAGPDRNIPWTEARMNAVTNALDSAGYIVASADDGGNRWGNEESITNYANLIQFLHDNFYIGPVFLLSPSMGGIVAQNLIMKRKAFVRALYVIDGVCDQIDMYAGFGSWQNTAFASTNLTNFSTLVKEYNAFGLPWKEFTGKAVRHVVGTTDTVVPPNAHGRLMVERMGRYPVECDILTIAGDHLATAHYNAADIVDFFGRYTNPIPPPPLPPGVGKMFIGRTAQNRWYINRVPEGEINAATGANQNEIVHLTNETIARFAWFPELRRLVSWAASGQYYSDDFGVTWTVCEVIGADLIAGGFANNRPFQNDHGQFIWNGLNTANGQLFYSRDGIKWIQVTRPSNTSRNAAIVGDKVFILGGTNTANQRAYTTTLAELDEAWEDGVTFSPVWTPINVGIGTVVAFGFGLTEDGRIYLHTDYLKGSSKYSAQGTIDPLLIKDETVSNQSNPASMVSNDCTLDTDRGIWHSYATNGGADIAYLMRNNLRQASDAAGTQAYTIFSGAAVNSRSSFAIEYDKAEKCLYSGGINGIQKHTTADGVTYAAKKIALASRTYTEIFTGINFEVTP